MGHVDVFCILHVANQPLYHSFTEGYSNARIFAPVCRNELESALKDYWCSLVRFLSQVVMTIISRWFLPGLTCAVEALRVSSFPNNQLKKKP